MSIWSSTQEGLKLSGVIFCRFICSTNRVSCDCDHLITLVCFIFILDDILKQAVVHVSG